MLQFNTFKSASNFFSLQKYWFFIDWKSELNSFNGMIKLNTEKCY